jgi:flagellar export protein FliJ
MRKFKFSLAKLLEVRRRMEKIRKQKLAAIQRDIDREMATLRVLNSYKNEAIYALKTLGLKETLDIPGIINRHYDLKTITEQIEQQKAAISTLKEKESIKRHEVIISRQNRRVVENLKDQAYAEYLKEGERLRQKSLDEIGLFQHIREGVIK